ncbi:MAG: SDR family NAD(P)-dependent oxidoreductase [Anaeromyxobacter sp.]
MAEQEAPRPVAVVTGASRAEGIGFEVCRQLARRGYAVVLTARDPQAARARAAELQAEGLDVAPHVLDVADEGSVAALARWLEAARGRVDVLVNNAAASISPGNPPSTTRLAEAQAALQVALFGAWRTTRALLPLLRRAGRSRVVNVSSGAGSHGDPEFGLASENAMGPAYAVAKAALNALTASFAAELRAEGIKVNAVCPGFTATFPGGAQLGARPVAVGAASVVWAAELGPDGPTGGFFRDGKPLPW